MAKSDNYESLEVIIDTREKDTVLNQQKNKTRMKIIRDFFDSKGAIVSKSKVDFCDYSIKGIFYRDEKPLEVNLGIQYKLLGVDLFPSLPGLPEVLFKSFDIFKDVSLIVEENGSYDILMNEDHTDGLFQNYGMQGSCEKQGTGLYSAYKNFMQRMCMCTIQARAIRSNEHFPMEVVSILKTISDPFYNGLYIRPQDHKGYMLNCLVKMPGIGPVTALELSKYVPNMTNLCSLRIDELLQMIGPLKAKILYGFLHNTEHSEQCNRNWTELQDMQQIGLSEKKEEKVKKPKRIISSILELLKERPCTIEEVQKHFGLSNEACFKELMELKNRNKAKYDLTDKLWRSYP